MRFCTPAAVAAVISVAVLLCPLETEAHNVTSILAKFPEFSTFNHYLTVTHLADDINTRETITVCAVDNAGMSDLLGKHLPLSSIKNVLAFHVLLDYFGAKKLHQITNGTALAATMYQATGSAPGSSGFVNITDLRGGKVGFGTEDNGGNLDSSFVKSLDEIPYNISVIQISNILSSPAAEAPAPDASQANLTSLMSAHGCKYFADALQSSGAEKMFDDNAVGGLTIFCPVDDVFKAFLPKYNNLTAAQQQSLLEFHGIPFYQPLPSLKSNNGDFNTLATDGANTYDFNVQNDGQDVLLKTTIVTAKITGTLVDEQPLAIFTIDKVLLPNEIFKGAPTPAPSPSPSPAADAPAQSKKKSKSPPAAADSPADSPGGDVADQTADGNGIDRISGERSAEVILGLSFAYAVLQFL